MTPNPFSKLRRRTTNWRFEQKAKRESLKRKGKGPFRGPTREGIFQTVNVGAGKWQNMEPTAKKFPKRQYVAVDTAYVPEWAAGSRLPASGSILRKIPNITLRDTNISKVIEEMKQKQQKTRHITVDMPDPDRDPEKLFTVIFDEAPQILLPNGKIFVSTESPHIATIIQLQSRSRRFKMRELPTITPEKKQRLTTTMSAYFEDKTIKGQKMVRQFEITFGLKKAIPDKNQRHHWPRTR